jgi:hypothetical protein
MSSHQGASIAVTRSTRGERAARMQVEEHELGERQTRDESRLARVQPSSMCARPTLASPL